MPDNPSEPTKGKRLTIALAILAILPAIYVAAYFGLVEVTHGGWSQPGQPRYGFGIPVVVFAPIHAIDRKLRPEVWEVIDWTPGHY